MFSKNYIGIIAAFAAFGAILLFVDNSPIEGAVCAGVALGCLAYIIKPSK